MLEINKIYNMDCLEGIKKIDDNSINAIITDPPYCVGVTHNGQKGVFSDLNTTKPFFTELFNEFKRVIKKDGFIYLFCDWKSYAFYFPIFERILTSSNLLVWDKGSGSGNYYSYVHELVIFKGFTNMNGKKVGPNVIQGIKGFSAGAKKTNGNKVHPTQKPLEIIDKFIKDSTKKDDLILDVFMGSGSTAVSCIKNKRNFIGFEIDEIYFDIANKRIQKVKEV